MIVSNLVVLLETQMGSRIYCQESYPVSSSSVTQIRRPSHLASSAATSCLPGGGWTGDGLGYDRRGNMCCMDAKQSCDFKNFQDLLGCSAIA